MVSNGLSRAAKRNTFQNITTQVWSSTSPCFSRCSPLSLVKLFCTKRNPCLFISQFLASYGMFQRSFSWKCICAISIEFSFRRIIFSETDKSSSNTSKISIVNPLYLMPSIEITLRMTDSHRLTLIYRSFRTIQKLVHQINY